MSKKIEESLKRFADIEDSDSLKKRFCNPIKERNYESEDEDTFFIRTKTGEGEFCDFYLGNQELVGGTTEDKDYMGNEAEESKTSDEECEDSYDSCEDSSEADSDCFETKEDWTSKQLEILNSALAAYRFLPRTTVCKLMEEFDDTRGNAAEKLGEIMAGEQGQIRNELARELDRKVCKNAVRQWLESRQGSTDGASRAAERCFTRRMRLEFADHAVGTPPKESRKVSFSDSVEIRHFVIDGNIE